MLDRGPCNAMRSLLLPGIRRVGVERGVERCTKYVLRMLGQVVLDRGGKIGVGRIRHDRNASRMYQTLLNVADRQMHPVMVELGAQRGGHSRGIRGAHDTQSSGRRNDNDAAILFD